MMDTEEELINFLKLNPQFDTPIFLDMMIEQFENGDAQTYIQAANAVKKLLENTRYPSYFYKRETIWE